MLRVRLVGGLGLELDGRAPAPPRSRRGRALLAWLALHPGDHARATLAARFWPDVLDESARASLRAALTELRAALGAGAGCVRATRETVGLEGDDLWVDARAIAALLRDGRAEEAVRIGSGELLTGFDEEWAHDARAEHERRLGEALELLAGRAESAGDLAAAVGHTRAAVALDPLDEAAGRRLIERLTRAGERAAALTAYERLAERLRRDLGVAPAPATRALIASIRGRDADAAPPAGDAMPAPPAGPVSLSSVTAAVPAPAALRRAQDSAFVGRERELGALRAAWDAARDGGGRGLVLLAGEPGVGKTRLALHFAQEAADGGALVLAGRCWEEPLRAYDSFAEALRPCADALGPPALEALAGPSGAELGRLLEGAGDAPSPEDRGARHRLFDAVDSALSALAVQRALLLVLDDLHWADRPTLRLLAFVLRSGRPAPLLVLGTYRDTDLGRHSPLTGALADLQRDRALERVAVRGLGREEVAALARGWLGDEAGGRVAATVHERTAGNAFFAEEVLRGFAESAEGTAPESVRQAVGARLSQLCDEANRLLAAAAVAGAEFDADVVAGASGLAGEAAEAALDDVLRAGLVRAAPGSPRSLEFAHALVREVVHDELNALRASRLHRRLAEELIARDPERHLEEIAHHLFESGSAGDEQRTAAYLARAGRRRAAMLAYEAAADLFDRALQVVGPDGELLLERGDALLRAGELDAARASFARAAELARARADADLLGRAALGYAGLGVTIVDIDEGSVALLEEALATLGADGDRALRSRLLARLGVELYYAPSRDRSEGLSAEAVAVARATRDARALASALGARHVALWRPDRLAERLRTADEMLAAARAAGDGQLELQARNWRVVDLFELGDLAGWREEARRHDELAQRLRLASYAWYTPLWQAVDLLHRGRFDEAAELREQARALGTRAGDRNAELFAQMLLGGEHFLRGSFDLLDLGWVQERIEHSAAGVSYIPAYAWVLAELGREDEARAQLARLAPGRFAALPFDANWPSALGELTHACVRLGERAHAKVLYELLSPYAGRPLTAGRAVVSYGAADRHLGCLAALLDRPGEAEGHFEAALALNAAAGMRPLLASTQLSFAEHLAARGELARAGELAGQAEAIALELGLVSPARAGADGYNSDVAAAGRPGDQGAS